MPEEIVLEELTDNSWSALLRKLREEKEDPSKGGCVLFLGPEALVSNQKTIHDSGYMTMVELLCEKAIRKIEQDTGVQVRYPGEKLSSFLVRESFMTAFPDIGDELWGNLFDEVYTVENIHPVFYEKLPYIPISILVNTSPDLLVKTIFTEKAGITGTQFSFYDYRSNSSQKREEEKLREPGPDTPVIYNLFGRIDYPGSVVISPEILLEYVFSMLSRGHEEINSLIYNEIKRAKYFMFLGFDFESWHLKLLLRFFDIKRSDRESKVTYARPWNLEKEETRQYFKKLFNVTFIKYNIVDFIAKMHAKCKEDPHILIRKPVPVHPGKITGDEITKENLYALLMNNKVTEVLEILEKYSKLQGDNDMRTACICLIQSFNELKTRYNQSLIADADYDAGRNLITNKISLIINESNIKD